MNRLVKVTLYRKDTLHNVNEAQITLYQYDWDPWGRQAMYDFFTAPWPEDWTLPLPVPVPPLPGLEWMF